MLRCGLDFLEQWHGSLAAMIGCEPSNLMSMMWTRCAWHAGLTMGGSLRQAPMIRFQAPAVSPAVVTQEVL
jgi:hypothetical protein